MIKIFCALDSEHMHGLWLGFKIAIRLRYVQYIVIRDTLFLKENSIVVYTSYYMYFYDK